MFQVNIDWGCSFYFCILTVWLWHAWSKPFRASAKLLHLHPNRIWLHRWDSQWNCTMAEALALPLSGPPQRGSGVHGQYVYALIMLRPAEEVRLRTGVKQPTDFDRTAFPWQLRNGRILAQGRLFYGSRMELCLVAPPSTCIGAAILVTCGQALSQMCEIVVFRL